MRAGRCLRLLTVVPVLLGPVGISARGAADSGPTFNKDIAPILWRHCATCHRAGEVGPFPLIDYADVVPRLKQIVTATAHRTMPPWLPDKGADTFVNARRLSDADIALIAKWADDGAPRGRDDDLPPRPKWPEGWQLGTPDLVLNAPAPFVLKPATGDVFRTFVLPIPITTTRYVRGIEVRPGNPSVVHHVSITIDRTRASRDLDEADPEPGFGGAMVSPGAHTPDSRALGWTPGLTPTFEPQGMAWRLAAGADLVVEMHLLPPAQGAVPVRPSVALYFSDMPPTRLSMDFKLGSNDIDIPAGDAAYTVEETFTLPVDVDVLSVYPHAHYLARQVSADATRPDGQVVSLVSIPEWDFHWQDEYRFTRPVHLPRDTVIRMRYIYDNSAANRHRPPGVVTRVTFGPLSSDEMGDLWLRLAPDTRDDAAALAQSYRDQERRKEMAFNERMVAQHPSDARWWTALGASYLAAGRLSDSVDRLAEALRLSPASTQAHNNLGQALRLQGRMRESIAQLQEAVRLAPANEVVHLNLANALEDNGDLNEAIVEFERVLALRPTLTEAHNNIGIALGALGRLDDARRHFESALAVDPDDVDARKNLDLVRQMQAASPR